MRTQEAAVRVVWAVRASVSGKRACQYLPGRTHTDAQAAGSGMRTIAPWLELASPVFAAIRRSKHRKYRAHALSSAALRRAQGKLEGC